ncbi:MAG TPA: ATP-binding protein [Candidatus Pacearchaeota archaeon]|nr:ATP-binding protein [Candidatus Pacearchaeota archaeon]
MIIAVTGGKGGTGKSTVATSLAVEFAKSKKTMLIDADAECPNDYLLISAKLKKYSPVLHAIPKFDFSKCIKCGKCAEACKQNAIVFVPGKYPAFVKDTCIGCMACKNVCPTQAITETTKQIGTIYTGKNYNINLVSSELKLGELASGEVVSEVRKKAEEISKKLKPDITLIDSAAGIGCPVIASLVGTDYIIAVTEPTPSAMHDLKRVLYLAEHFKINPGIIINKFDLDNKFYKKIENFAKSKKIPVIGKIPYNKDFVQSTIKMKPVIEINKEYSKIFKEIIKKIN